MERKELIEKIMGLPELMKAERCETMRIRRIATWESPKIEYAYQNMDTFETIAFEFPNLELTEDQWIKESLDTLSSFDVCVVSIPSSAIDRAYYYCEILLHKDLGRLPISVIVFDAFGHIAVVKMYEKVDTMSRKRSNNEQKSYWCWWRDTSNYEVVTLLELSRKYQDIQGDIYSTKVYPEFYDMMINQETRQWDGTPRKKNYSLASYKSEKQNYKIPMCQLGFWDVSTGHLTEKGNMVLEVARENGDGSKVFLYYLSKIILLDGKHLDLINDLEDFQKNCSEQIPEASSEFFVLFDRYMEEKNSIGTRKPTAVTTGAKRAYVRDEPKLWNKLGIIIPSGKGRYYWPFKGIKFDWQKINEILISTSAQEENNE